MKYTGPIECLKKELNGWKQAKKSIMEVIYQNDSSIGSDNIHNFYNKEAKNCDIMITMYKSAITKLKAK